MQQSQEISHKKPKGYNLRKLSGTITIYDQLQQVILTMHRRRIETSVQDYGKHDSIEMPMGEANRNYFIGRVKRVFKAEHFEISVGITEKMTVSSSKLHTPTTITTSGKLFIATHSEPVTSNIANRISSKTISKNLNPMSVAPKSVVQWFSIASPFVIRYHCHQRQLDFLPFFGGSVVVWWYSSSLYLDYDWLLLTLRHITYSATSLRTPIPKEANDTFINLIHNVNLLTLEPAVILAGLSEDNMVCTFGGYLILSTSIIGIVNQAFLAINRYFYLFKPDLHRMFFRSKLYKLFYIFLMYAVFFPLEAAFLFWDEIGFFHDICGLSLQRIQIWHAILLFIVPTFLCYTVCIIVAYRISRFVKNHVTNHVDRVIQSKIKEGRSIVKFIILEIMLPIILESPILFTFMLHAMVPIPNLLDTVFTGLFLLHTALDPVITVAVIKPYRQEFLQYIRKIFKKDQVESITASGRYNTMKNNTTNNGVTGNHCSTDPKIIGGATALTYNILGSQNSCLPLEPKRLHPEDAQAEVWSLDMVHPL
uniref:G-protein coupled receptors family 1 profile domain-containing protein n=1 Tax=Romanomermis culicivorax TaxID=13658 RepID=A0A915L9M3_ROMCU